MKTISSRQNALFKRIRDAIRDHAGEIVIEGPKFVADAIRIGWTPIAIATGEKAPPPVDAPVYHFTSDLFDALTETKSPQNMLGLFARPQASPREILSRRDTIAVALDAVQDPGNVGTIVRLAAAFDAAGVLLLPGCADAFGPKAIRASAGAILTVPVAGASYDDLADVAIVATAMDGERVDPPSRDAVLVFGNEGAGVSEALLRRSRRIAIPMSGKVESLNVAASAAILLARSYSLRGSS